ncbi:hypothetical protein [Paenibacillus pedocola]|uniref:hypothetical protein n=1 Tax=Paenibacillus pedocola TaxID=3242193 RepID=UPI0028775CDD|nr:hypothetical protein [Paenibacillus typhae]
MRSVIEMRVSPEIEFGYECQFIKEEKKIYGLIVLRSKLNKKEYVVSSVTQFLAEEYICVHTDTERKRAYQLIRFLNFLLQEKEIRSFAELEKYHGTEFLNSLGRDPNKIGKTAIESYEFVLFRFYMFLINKGVLREEMTRIFLKDSITGTRKINPFGVSYPEERRRALLHDIPEVYLPLFLKIAEKIAKPIALGVYLQIYGGIRVSETVSLCLEDTRLMGIGGEYGFQIDIKNGSIERTDIKNHAISTVKKVRTQHVDPIDPFSNHNTGLRLYYEHIELYYCKDALFVNPSNSKYVGKAMTRKNYARYFNKVRDEFCKQLMNSNSAREREYGAYLSRMNWSTHICRGIFTNMKARTLKNAFQVQYARGDGTLEAAISYYEKAQLIKHQREASFNQTEFVRDLAERSRFNKEELKYAISEAKQVVLMESGHEDFGDDNAGEMIYEDSVYDEIF